METDETVRILRRLTDDEGAPARIDLVAAIRTGRQRRRRRRITAGVASAVAVTLAIAAAPLVGASLFQPPKPTKPAPPVLVSPSPGPSPSTSTSPGPGPASICVEHVLTGPGGLRTSGTVLAGDPTGRYLAGNLTPNQVTVADQFAVWDHDVPTVVTATQSGPTKPPSNPMAPAPADVAPDGTVIGGWNSRAWIYTNGRFAELAGLAGYDTTTAVAIGDQGTIAGYSLNKSAGLGAYGIPIKWSSATSSPLRLKLPGSGWTGVVSDVDADGTIVGNVVHQPSSGGNGGSFFTDPPWHDVGIIWRPDGSYRLVHPPTDVPHASGLSIVSARHGVLFVMVEAVTSKTAAQSIPFLYDVSTGRFTRLPNVNYSANMEGSGGAGIIAFHGNAMGWFVGLYNGPDAPGMYTPDTGPFVLPKLNPGGVNLSPAYTINDTGTIVGGTDAPAGSGSLQPVYWSCR